MVPALDHDGLLTVARKAQAAAGDADVERLAEHLDTLVCALNEHFRTEAPLLNRLAPGEARLLHRGQLRVSKAARKLLKETAAGCTGSRPRCSARAEELVAFLALQAHDERLSMLGARASTPRCSRWPS